MLEFVTFFTGQGRDGLSEVDLVLVLPGSCHLVSVVCGIPLLSWEFSPEAQALLEASLWQDIVNCISYSFIRRSGAYPRAINLSICLGSIDDDLI